LWWMLQSCDVRLPRAGAQVGCN